MKHSEMVSKIAKSGDDIADQMTGELAHMLHMAIGVAGEAGEILEAYDHSMSTGKPLDKENVLEELGDIEFYLEGFRQSVGIHRNQTNDSIIPDNDPTKEHAPIAAVKLVIVASALLDAVKKVVMYQKDLDVTQLLAPLTAINNLLSSIRNIEDYTLEAVLEHNVNKLGKRYSGFTYSDEAAQLRADKA